MFRSVLTKVIFSILLLSIGIFSLYRYLDSSEYGLLNLDYPGDISQLSQTPGAPLLKGYKTSGSFQSPYSNLGMILVRFNNINQGSDDTLVFRIKESQNTDYFYEANYKTDQFQSNQLFPFGFPQMADSKGKSYTFEIESVRGTIENGVYIDPQEPIFIAKSTFKKQELLQGKSLLPQFLSEKVINIWNNPKDRTNLILFLLPFYLYILHLFSSKIGLKFPIIITFVLTVWDVLFLNENFDSLYLSVLLFWTLTIARFRFNSRVSAVLSLGYLLLTSIMLVVNQNHLAEKISVWAFFFLCITVGQQFYEYKKRFRNFSH